MGVMELVSFVQSRFAITVDPSEVVVENFDSVRQLAGFIRRKLATPKAVKAPEYALQAGAVATVGAVEQTSRTKETFA